MWFVESETPSFQISKQCFNFKPFVEMELIYMRIPTQILLYYDI